jgi:hypothetical protein
LAISDLSDEAEEVGVDALADPDPDSKEEATVSPTIRANSCIVSLEKTTGVGPIFSPYFFFSAMSVDYVLDLWYNETMSAFDFDETRLNQTIKRLESKEQTAPEAVSHSWRDEWEWKRPETPFEWIGLAVMMAFLLSIAPVYLIYLLLVLIGWK